MSDYLELPMEQLSKDALQGVIEDYITREGTDYGLTELSLDQKVEQVRAQLSAGRAIIVFDRVSESCSLILKEQ